MSKWTINNKSNKRILVPDRSDYSCYTKKENDVWVLKNGNGKVVYSFKNEQEKKQKTQAMCDVLMNMFMIKRVEFEIHRSKHPEYYSPTYEEANWTHKALYNGFKVDSPTFNPYENWFGMSRSCYSNQCNGFVMTRDNKKIKCSFQFIGLFDFPNRKMTEGEEKILQKADGLYIGFFEDNTPVYEHWTGVLPDMDFIENFISVKN